MQNFKPPLGLCQCGCGAETGFAPKTNSKKGYKKGDRLRYIPGHAFGEATLLERFLAKTEQSPDGCLVWTAALDSNGYGRFWNGDRLVEAHRFSYESQRGKIPPGMQIDHLCMNRRCVRIEHLEVVTPRENLLRSGGMASQNALKAVCPNGHPLSGENLYSRPDGRGRDCRECRREASRRRPKHSRR